MGLPALALSKDGNFLTKKLLAQSIEKSSKENELELELEFEPGPLSTESDEPETPHSTPQCELIVYLQQQPIYMSGSPYEIPGPVLQSSLRKMEHHLRYPNGNRYLAVPDITMSMTAYSPDCGYILQSDGQSSYAPREDSYLRGPKLEVFLSRGRRDISIFAAVLVLEVWLTIRQMREASTPSMRSRISIYTITTLSLGDGFAFCALTLLSLLFEPASLMLRATAFFALLGFKFYGIRFLVELWSVQAPERQRQER